ncbi:hypothetical protein B4086_5740 [Bacillus cereus]|nr:hypothetical protein B4086_5740 [Bacillus cereus]
MVKIEEVYQQILDGERCRFPHGTWSKEGDKESARRLTRYLIEDVLHWDKETVKKQWRFAVIQRHKLRGMLDRVYDGEPFRMLDDAYPEQFYVHELLYAHREIEQKEVEGD